MLLVYFGKAIHFKSFAQLLTIKEITRSINIVNAVADASIAAVLVFLLQKSRTGFRTSETIINRLIIFTVNTGLLTGCTAIVCLIMNIVFPDTFLYILFYLMTSRRMFLNFAVLVYWLMICFTVYVNSLYATLNSRKSILSGSMETSEGMNSISLGRIRSKPFGWSGASREKVGCVSTVLFFLHFTHRFRDTISSNRGRRPVSSKLTWKRTLPMTLQKWVNMLTSNDIILISLSIFRAWASFLPSWTSSPRLRLTKGYQYKIIFYLIHGHSFLEVMSGVMLLHHLFFLQELNNRFSVFFCLFVRWTSKWGALYKGTPQISSQSLHNETRSLNINYYVVLFFSFCFFRFAQEPTHYRSLCICFR